MIDTVHDCFSAMVGLEYLLNWSWDVQKPGVPIVGFTQEEAKEEMEELLDSSTEIENSQMSEHSGKWAQYERSQHAAQ